MGGIPEVLYCKCLCLFLLIYFFYDLNDYLAMTNFFDLNEEFYRVKGIFRVCGSMEEENELKERLE